MGQSKNDPLLRVPPITLTREALTNFRPLANHVLLKQQSDNTQVKFNDTHLVIDPSWKPEFHVDRVFTVVALPDKLTMDKSQFSMNWHTDQMLKVGDRVWINYLHSIKPIYRIECDGDKYIVLHYMFIYLAVRRWIPADHDCYIVVPSALIQDRIKLSKQGDAVLHPPSVKFEINLIDEDDNPVSLPPNVVQDSADIIDDRLMSHQAGHFAKATFLSEVIMCNGYILFEPEKIEHTFSHLLSNKPRNTYGTIRFYGKPNQRYKEREYCDDNYIASNHKVLLKFSQFVTLEDPLHILFPWPVPLCVTQRRYILSVVDPSAGPMEIKNYLPPDGKMN